VKRRTDNRRFWQVMDGYKLGMAVVLALLTLFFLVVTIMPIILFQNLENVSWEFKTFAMAHRPLAALMGLALFLATGGVLLRVAREPQTEVRARRRVVRPAGPEESKQQARGQQRLGLDRLLHRLGLPRWEHQAKEPAQPSAGQPVVEEPAPNVLQPSNAGATGMSAGDTITGQA
jgi:hypothetical protein